MGKTFYTISDGKIDRVQTGESPVGNADWKEAPENWGGQHGDKLDWFDGAMRRIPDAELIEQGKRKDKKGRWYHKEQPGETVQIDSLDEEPGDDYTREAPLENEPHQKFSGQENKWVVDAEGKERAEKKSRLAGLKSQVSELEAKAQRPLREKELGIDVEQSAKKIRELQGEIESLRPEIKNLEAELKSA